MSGSITVPGSHGQQVDLTHQFTNQFNTALARSIADALADAQSKTNLLVTPFTGSGAVPPANPDFAVNELDIAASVTKTTIIVPSGYQYVVDESAGPDTIIGTGGLSIIGVTGDHTIVDPAVITLGDTSPGSVNNVTVTGSGDAVAVGNGSNTITGTGSGTMSGGTGNDTFIESGGASYVINSNGFADTIRAADGGTTVNSTGPGASIVGGRGALTALVSGGTITGGRGSEVDGGAGALTVTVSGTSDTIFGGRGAADVTLSGGPSGSKNSVVVGSVAGLTVLDNGTGDTIDAGQGFSSVTAPGGSFVRGGSGPLNFVGGTGPSTIIGATGTSTVFGGTGLTSIVGGPGGATTYVNTTAGGLAFAGGSGAETVDASLSKSSSTLWGGAGGPNLLIGGAGPDYIAAGSGPDTLVGGGGANWFFFVKAAIGPGQNEVVADFSSLDNVMLNGYGSNPIVGTITSGSSTTITLSDNTKITFTGLTDPGALNGHIAIV